jgi:hypothetical protein
VIIQIRLARITQSFERITSGDPDESKIEITRSPGPGQAQFESVPALEERPLTEGRLDTGEIPLHRDALQETVEVRIGMPSPQRVGECFAERVTAGVLH